MGMNPLTIDDLKFPEGKLPSILLYDWGSSGKKYIIRVLTKHGIESKTYTVSSDRSMTTREFRLSNLPIMVSCVAGEANIRRGELYVLANLYFAGVKDLTLFCGYITHARRFSWPPGVFEHMTEGPGLLRSVTGTNPAAGAEMSETVPANARWRLIALIVQLVTDATAASRRPHFIVDDGVNTLFEVESGTDQTASQTIRYNFANTGYRAMVAAQNVAYLTAPFYLPLFQGWRVRTSTVNLQAGDNYGAPQLLVEEWIEE